MCANGKGLVSFYAVESGWKKQSAHCLGEAQMQVASVISSSDCMCVLGYSSFEPHVDRRRETGNPGVRLRSRRCSSDCGRCKSEDNCAKAEKQRFRTMACRILNTRAFGRYT